MKLEQKLDACWRSSRRAPPRSRRRVKLEVEMFQIQMKRLKRDIKAGRAKK